MSRLLFASVLILLLAGCGPRVSPEQKAKAIEAFATVEKSSSIHAAATAISPAMRRCSSTRKCRIR